MAGASITKLAILSIIPLAASVSSDAAATEPAASGVRA